MPKLSSIILLVLGLCCYSFSGAPNQKNKIVWLDISNAEKALTVETRPVLIDLYTDWCGWCKVMDRKTYTNKDLTAYVQNKFYAVKINAESKSAIKWKGQTFNFSQVYHANEFALFVTNGQLAFPTTVIIPTDGSAPQAIPGYLKPAELELFLKYYGEQNNKNLSIEAYMKKAKPTW